TACTTSKSVQKILHMCLPSPRPWWVGSGSKKRVSSSHLVFLSRSNSFPVVRVLERAARARKPATKISSVKDFAETRTSRADTVDSSSAVDVITKDENSAGGVNDGSGKACNIVAIVGNG